MSARARFHYRASRKQAGRPEKDKQADEGVGRGPGVRPTNDGLAATKKGSRFRLPFFDLGAFLRLIAGH